MVLRNDRGYTREQLAELADISDKFLYEIETGKKGFSAITLMNLSKALEVSLDYIMTGTGSRKYDSEIAAAIEKFKPDTLEQVDRILKAAYEISKEEKWTAITPAAKNEWILRRINIQLQAEEWVAASAATIGNNEADENLGKQKRRCLTAGVI